MEVSVQYSYSVLSGDNNVCVEVWCGLVWLYSQPSVRPERRRRGSNPRQKGPSVSIKTDADCLLRYCSSRYNTVTFLSGKVAVGWFELGQR
ncbi:hypothetical protein PoB_007403400 [Plakobranchus ocellatus]|uniref:Uncharacterized protein n=1 Tax=Plakobranchus ocellatus TaxID=259542 RepID=A0AAV4DTH5_9GAST|nr:hypothetical protein PoB_007403400 [Plakobranchus ocellatus]